VSKQIQVFLLFTAAYFLSYFYRSANAVIAPDLANEMGLDAAQLGLMTSLFFAAFASIQIPLGMGLDRWGSRWVTPALMSVGVIGSLVFAAGLSFPMLALGRALIGVGMAGILMGALKAFSQWFSPHRFSTVSGLLIGLGSCGALVAASPLAWLNQAFGWRAVFAGGALVIALVALSMVIWTRNTPPGVSWPGRTTTGGSLSGVFGDIRFWRIAPLILFTNGTLLAFQGLWAGPYLFDIFRLDELAAGNILFLISLGATIGFVLSGWLGDRLGLTRVILLGTVIFIICQFVLAAHPPLPVVRPVGFLLGVFGGFTFMLLTQARHVFPSTMTGRAVTAANLFAIGGTFLLQWLMGLIIGLYLADAAGHYPPQAYTAALLFTAAGTLISLIWYLPMRQA
jgi:nitrate/nitrite transporter NarK